ncbi:MAG: CoB--CoM heterodisulfide reductase subunit C [Candidatus Lokiarchaeota archaeon]|nr:CoB--CoM heterodisulfide reductase subunit C [Candidatus Harpocratesius repetitus]
MEKIQRNIIVHISDIISEEIIKDEAMAFVRACFQCGTCSGGCPSGRRTAIRTRQIIRRVILGLEEVLSSDDIWLCSTCYTCFERCPRSIPVTDIIIKLRNLATQRGYMKPPHKAVTHILADTGHGVPLGTQKGGEPNNWSQLRASYGLPDIPPTTHSHPEAVKDIQILMHATNFDKLVDWKPKNTELKPKVNEKSEEKSEGKNEGESKVKRKAKSKSKSQSKVKEELKPKKEVEIKKELEIKTDSQTKTESNIKSESETKKTSTNKKTVTKKKKGLKKKLKKTRISNKNKKK